MKSLLETINAKPALAALSGSIGGFFAWFVAHADTLARIFQLVGGFFGCLLAVVSFLFAAPRFLRFCRAWIRRGFLGADVE